jgi:hypothetical protein
MDLHVNRKIANNLNSYPNEVLKIQHVGAFLFSERQFRDGAENTSTDTCRPHLRTPLEITENILERTVIIDKDTVGNEKSQKIEAPCEKNDIALIIIEKPVF